MYFSYREKIRLVAAPLCAAFLLAAAVPPAHALDVREKLKDDLESFATFGQNAPMSPEPLSVPNEEMALASIDQQQYLQDFSQSNFSSQLLAASPIDFVRRDAQGNEIFSYSDDPSTGSKEVREGDGVWVYENGILTSYESPAAGRVTYEYDPQGSLTGITQTKDGVTTVYDESGRPLRSLSTSTLVDYTVSGAYQGYADRETDLASGTVYFYEYTTAPDGTVHAVRRASRALDVASDTLSVSSSSFADYTLNPFLDIQFNFGSIADRPQTTVSASAYDPAAGWAIFSATAELNKVRIYWTRYDAASGQTTSGEQSVDYVFNRTDSYRLKLSWQSAQAHVDVIAPSETRRIYTLASAAWNPRFMATGSNAGIAIHQSQGISNLIWQRDYQLRNLDVQTPVAGRFTIDPTAKFVTLAQSWSDATAQTSVWYDARAKRLNGYTNRLNAGTGNWVYEYFPAVPLNLTAGVDYRFETTFADGRIRLFIWQDGTAKPAQPVWDVAGFASIAGFTGSLSADGAALEVLASGSDPEPVAAVRHADLTDYRRNWVYTERGLEVYESPETGELRYQYGADGQISGITQERDGLVTVYDAYGTALYADSAFLHVEFIASGPYQGYPATETDLQTSESFVYEYSTEPDGTVTAQKRSASPLDISGLSLSASSSRYLDRAQSPLLDVEFGFGDLLSPRAGVTLSASAYDPLQRWAVFNVTAETDRIRVYWAGQSFVNQQSFNQEWQIAYAFDSAKTYRIRMAWEGGEVRTDLYADGVFDRRIHTLTDAAWDPRFFVSSSDMEFQIRQTNDPALFRWSRSLRLTDLRIPSATAARVRMNPLDPSAAFGQTWSDDRSQITVRYDLRRKRFDLYVYRYDAARGWVYESAPSVPLNLQAGLDYRTETRLENGRWLLYVWEDGAARPAQATVDLAGFDGTGGVIRAELTGEGADVEVAGGTAVATEAERSALPVEAARYRFYPALASASDVWNTPGEYLTYFDQSANAVTGLPLSHIGNDEPLDIAHAYDVALYILGGGAESEKIMQHLIGASAFVENANYVPAGGIYSDLSQTGEWQPGFDRWNVHAGPNAWLGIAAIQLYLATGKREYLDFALERAAFLKGLQQPDGGLVMGPRGQFGIFPDIRSTENNFSALHFFENLAAVTQDPRHQTTADGIWGYVKTLYDPASHTFLRGERRFGSVWVRDAVDLFATDTVSWMPLERVLDDAAFGVDASARLAEVGRMITAAESRTGIYRPDGQLAGFSFSQSSKALGVISIEWSLQFANFYLKVAQASRQAGDTAAFDAYEEKYLQLVNRVSSYFVTPSQGVRIAPYAVYLNGEGAYNRPTGHDFNTPACAGSCEDVYSLPSAYFKFASNGVDPLRPAFAPILESDYL